MATQGRKPNVSDGKTFRITVSEESYRLLEELAARGIYGRKESEVAARFVDQALQRFAEEPKFELKVRPKPTE